MAAGKWSQAVKKDGERTELLTQLGRMTENRTSQTLPRSETRPRLKSVAQEKQQPVGTMPLSTGREDSGKCSRLHQPPSVTSHLRAGWKGGCGVGEHGKQRQRKS